MINVSLLWLKGKIKPISFNVDDYDNIFIVDRYGPEKVQQGTGSRIWNDKKTRYYERR